MTSHAPSVDGAVPLTVGSALELTKIGSDQFRSPVLTFGGEAPLYGGQLVAQGLRAASMTVRDEQVAQSLHSYFLRPALPNRDLDFAVERERDGRRSAWRRVVASQAGETVFTLSCLFFTPKPGYDYQAIAMPSAAPPEELRGYRLGTRRTDVSRLLDLDLRYFEDPEPWHGGPLQLWIRVREPLSDSANVHACGLAFMSDMSNGLSTAPQAGPNSRLLSLDHTVWLHRSVRADQWLLLDLQPHITSGGRGLYTGRFFERSGVLVATLAQECLFDNPAGAA